MSGSVGPLGVSIEPWVPTSFDQAKESFKEKMKVLVEGGVDLISLETFGDISELQKGILVAKEVYPDITFIAMIIIKPDGQLPVGTSVEWSATKIKDWGVDAIGFNCSVGPQPIMSAVNKIKSIVNCPIVVQPNAGLPKLVDGRSIYMCTPEYMAEFTKHFLKEGVQFIGGCCGTSPQHIKSMAQAFRHQNEMRHSDMDKSGEFHHSQLVKPEAFCADGCQRVPLQEKSMWSAKIVAGEKVTSVKFLPPATVVPSKILERSKILKDAGVDAINIPDGPRASARMRAILTAVMIEKKIGIETVLHYTCRDRNLLGMQSDMMGSYAIGLRNMLLVTGDPPKLGNYPDAIGVFDVDAIGLTNMVNHLKGGEDLGGRPLVNRQL